VIDAIISSSTMMSAFCLQRCRTERHNPAQASAAVAGIVAE
jgi:hypothetical protein